MPSPLFNLRSNSQTGRELSAAAMQTHERRRVRCCRCAQPLTAPDLERPVREARVPVGDPVLLQRALRVLQVLASV